MKTPFLLLCLFSMIFAKAQSGKSDAKWLTHTDAENKISLQYPANWDLKPPSGNALFFVTSKLESEQDTFRENVNCLVPMSVGEGYSIKMGEEEIVKTLSSTFDDFKIVKSGYSRWNGAEAYEIEYTCTKAGNGTTYHLHMLQKVAIIKGKMYALTYTALADSYDQYIPSVRKMLDSFKVL